MMGIISYQFLRLSRDIPDRICIIRPRKGQYSLIRRYQVIDGWKQPILAMLISLWRFSVM